MQLSPSTLDSLPQGVSTPSYDREALNIGIVHLGVGAFHRAHMAAYVDACLNDDPNWGICGVSLRSAATRDELSPQDCLYTHAVDNAEQLNCRIIGALKEVLVAREQPDQLAQRLQAPTTRIVSLTVTEKGYCHDPATGRLDIDHPDIQHDLTTPEYPRSAVGWIVQALEARREAGTPAFTVLSCDNLPSNGALLKVLLIQFAEQQSADFAGWIERQVECPSTMVDRIVPAVTDEGRATVQQAIGVQDDAPVLTEPFSQFVVEDRFPMGRPAWETHGVTMVEAAEPFENMKLRLLNGSHSTLAYLGCLAGYETVSEAIADKGIRALIARMMNTEIAPTLAMPEGVDLDAYQRALIKRFDNPALKHRTAQIAMDGSQKLPQRLLATIQYRIEASAPFPCLALGVAAWIAYVTQRDSNGDIIPVDDPFSEDLLQKARQAGASVDGKVNAFLSDHRIFPKPLSEDSIFVSAIKDALQSIVDLGAVDATYATSARAEPA